MSLWHRQRPLQVCSPVPLGAVVCPQPEATQCHNLLLPRFLNKVALRVTLGK